MNQTTAANPGSEDPGFLRAVADLAVQRPVVTTRAIYNAQGVKLLEGGVTVDAGLYDRLLSHRLAAPLDESLASHEPVDGVALVEAAQAALERWPFFALMGPAGRMRGMLLEAI